MKFSFIKDFFDGRQRLPKTDITRRFELLGRVGQGSMSRVWRARDTMSGKVVALKVLDKDKTERYESRFAPELKKPSEGEIAVTLKHPHIVNTFEWGTTYEGEQFLVMEFLDGLGLSYLVDVQNELMQKCRLTFMLELGDALRYFHEQKWIHRDICPRNIMVTDADHQIKLIDFGLVVPNTSAFQAPGNRTGTANYMAPELIKRMRTDQRIDIFSYSITCYEMFARRLPWEAAETLEAVLQHMNTRPLDIREAVPGIDEQVAAVIMKGLALDPKERWQKIDPMIYQFREAQERLFPRPARPKRHADAGDSSQAGPAKKKPPPVRTPGIRLADDQPEPSQPKRSKSATPGISLAEDDTPEGSKPAPSNPQTKPVGSTPGIRLADDNESPAQHERPVKATGKPAGTNPGIRLADEGNTAPSDIGS
jgi:serine/threonine protein kinase